MATSTSSMVTSLATTLASSLTTSAASSTTTDSPTGASTFPTPTGSGTSNGGQSGQGPTSSPLLFFVALGFGVVFTNLWIIVGVKYCFRYNQRNRMRAAGLDPAEIDLATMGGRPRRRREKKLMSMEEVNERFPLTKYKTWRAGREAKGLPAEGGVNANDAAVVQADAVTIDTTRDPKASSETARPQTALGIAQQDHINAASPTPAAEYFAPGGVEKVPLKTIPEKNVMARADTADTVMTVQDNQNNEHGAPEVIAEAEDDDDDDPIRTAAPPEMLSAPGDACAICLDNLDSEDDVRGLTCGHAFHAACVDPWLTSRRACCPLCKADYYVPKPRTEAEDLAFGARLRNNGTAPQTPQAAWVEGRGPFRSRFLIGNPRYLLQSRNAPEEGQRRYRTRTVATSESLNARAQQNSSTQPRSWLPSMPRFGRSAPATSDATAHGAVQEVSVTPNDLEAGTRR